MGRACSEADAHTQLPRPPHHDPGGGFRNPWPTAYTREEGGLLRWRRERRKQSLAPNPTPHEVPRAEPRVSRKAGLDDFRVTYVGHATFLIQLGGINVLTDPHWSPRASPVQFAGPVRFSPPGIAWEELPRIDAVLISHDHYDHLDVGTVRRITQRFGDAVDWFTPLGYQSWLRRQGVSRVQELDWWGAAEIVRTESPVERISVVALPSQHWTSRTPWDRGRRLWCSWSLRSSDGRNLYFAGDSGYFPGFTEIGEVAGPFDVLLLPIGAYEPRWFMRPVHMNPEEAIQTYLDLGGVGTMIGMHWGTFRLTDEDPLEPPDRTRKAWTAAGLPDGELCILPIGGTWIGG